MAITVEFEWDLELISGPIRAGIGFVVHESKPWLRGRALLAGKRCLKKPTGCGDLWCLWLAWELGFRVCFFCFRQDLIQIIRSFVQDVQVSLDFQTPPEKLVFQ